MNNKYEAVIGLEIHAELNTKTKMFCRCKNDPFHSKPNSNICPVCLGLPGALPVANQAAVESTIMVGLALGCDIAPHSKWDRKNYFYPDLPKGYQISQYDLPLCQCGELGIRNYELGNDKIVKITRIHLEEDTGTLQHPQGADYSLVNYNRSGVPLLELVTEPDIRFGKEARLFAEEYQRILRTLGAGNADMEKGEMRVEVNISLRETGNLKQETRNYGTKVEIKNLNSFRSVEKAINYEMERQSKILESGQPVVQETRGWHDEKQVTFSQRSKEEAADYRYFPEPDLPPLELTKAYIDSIRMKMPALPSERRGEYTNLGLKSADAEVLVNNHKLAAYFGEVVAEGVDPKLAANWVINDAPDMTVGAKALAELLTLLEAGNVSTAIAKDILKEMKEFGKSAKVILEEKGIEQISGTEAIETLIDQVLATHPQQVADYKAGKEQIYGFLVGQVMREAKGQANPQVLHDILRKKLGG